MNPRSNHGSDRSFQVKRAVFLCALVLLLAVIVLLSARALLTGPTPEEGGSGIADGAVSTDGDRITINDLYSGEIEIPRFNIPLNTYQSEKFLNDQGVIRYDSEDAMLGIDVSEFQGDIDWETVKASGVEFAIIRCGFTGSTKGKNWTDEYFEKNYEGATAAGLPVGVYYLSQATSETEAEDEASYVLQLLSGKKPTLPVVFDWETVGGDDSRTKKVNMADLTSFASTFCRKIQQAGHTAAVYFNRSQGYEAYDLKTLSDANFDFWLAEYTNVPAFYYHFDIWQYSDNAMVQGIDTAVDIDICFKKYG